MPVFLFSTIKINNQHAIENICLISISPRKIKMHTQQAVRNDFWETNADSFIFRSDASSPHL